MKLFFNWVGLSAVQFAVIFIFINMKIKQKDLTPVKINVRESIHNTVIKVVYCSVIGHERANVIANMYDVIADHILPFYCAS